jgi:hypothetical protein
MAACSYVGRVGGLAIALGVGSAVLGGTAVGWADDARTGPSTDRSGSSQSSTADGAPSSVGTRGTAAITAGRRGEAPPNETTSNETAANETAPNAATVSPRRGQSAGAVQPEIEPGPRVSALNPHSTNRSEQPAAVVAVTASQPPVEAPAPVEVPVARATDAAAAVESAPLAVAASQSAPVAAILPAAPAATQPVSAPAPVASVLTAAATALTDPFAGSNTGIPVGSPLDWATLAFARRNPAAETSTASVPPAAAITTAPLPIILGPSGVPIPSAKYGNTVMSYYIPNGIPGTQQLVFTPEGLYPITGIKSLPLNTSVDQGIQILSDVLTPLPAGTPVTVFGYSQSAIIGSLLQGGYTVEVDGQDVKFGVPEGLADSINFVFVGNEMNPNGGFLSRFSGRDMPILNLPSLGIPFYGPTPGGPLPPTGQEYATTNYQREYDGFSDFPRYPINFLSVLNAALGIAYVHVQYTPTISQEQCAQKAFCLLKTEVEAAVPLPSTSPSQQYFFIPTENLPLLQPLRDIPFIGNPLADLIQPALKVIVDFGYADPAHGFTTGTQPNGNELTPFGVTPPFGPVYGEAFTKFFEGIEQGIADFIADFGPNGSVAQDISAFSLANLGPLGMGASGGFIQMVQNVINSVSDAISGTVAGLYAPLLPTADVINAIVLSLPAYSLNLFLYGMEKVFSGDVIGGLLDAFGLPIAANVGLITMAGLVGAGVWAGAVLEYT